MTLTDVEIIELAAPQRADRFTFMVLNPDRTPVGAELKAHADSPPQLQVQTSRTSFRTMSGLIVEDPPIGIDLNRARIAPILTLSNGTARPLGVLMFGSLGRNVYAGREVWQPELFDETFLLDQGLDRTWTVAPGASVLTAFAQMAAEVLDPIGVPRNYLVTDRALPGTVPLVFRAGTSRQAALVSLSALLGALPPFFSHDGAHSLKLAPQPGAIDHVYAAGTRIFDATTTLSESWYKAPNRYIVVGGDVAGVPVRGVYDLPAPAPNSFANTGRIVTAPIHSVSGVTDEALATQIAYVDALTDKTTYATATYSAAADPRHDIFDSVSLFGVPYLETGWTLTCESGGAHAHQLAATYA